MAAQTSTHNITPFLFYPGIGADSARGFYFKKK
nr:MAG TPA: hypothetical protein [Caudoviricetes sp.]